MTRKKGKIMDTPKAPDGAGQHVTAPGKPAAKVPEPHGSPLPPPHQPTDPAVPHRAAAPVPETRKPETFAAKVAEVIRKLDVAVSAKDRAAVDACYKDAEALKPGTPEDHLEHAALCRRLAHFGPM